MGRCSSSASKKADVQGSMNAQRRFGDQNLQLVEFAQKVLLELPDKTGAATRAKVKSRQHDDLIQEKLCSSLPETLERKAALLRSQAAEALDQAALDRLKLLILNGASVVVGQREI